MGNCTFESLQLLPISGIQHFAICRRRWALIHIESIWEDNVFTTAGSLLHGRVHSPSADEKRVDIIVTRSMPVHSYSLKVQGVCDVVEFKKDHNGIGLFGRDGLWMPCPIEYKLGCLLKNNADKLQLCVQAMCLEEMLLCSPITEAYIFHGKTRRREIVVLDNDLRSTAKKYCSEMHDYYARGYTPQVKTKTMCRGCSLKDQCLPCLPTRIKVSDYIQEAFVETD